MKYEGRALLRGSEPGHVRQREEAYVPARDHQRVGDALEAADLHCEIVEALGLALLLRPGRAAPPSDEMPELEVVARQIVGALRELEVVPAMCKTAHGDLKRSKAAECSQEIGAETANLIARRIGT